MLRQLMFSRHFQDLESWHEIFWEDDFCPGIFWEFPFLSPFNHPCLLKSGMTTPPPTSQGQICVKGQN